MDADTAVLFPDSFDESEIGKIPSGWNGRNIGDLAHIRHGFAFKGEFFRTEPTSDVLLTPGNFAIGGGFKADKFKYYEGPVPEDFILRDGDLLVTMTDLSKMGDTLGYPAIVPRTREVRFLHNQRLGKVELKANAGIGTAFLYQTFCLPAYRHHVLGSASGSTVKHTSPDRIKAFEVPVPDEEVATVFERATSSLQGRLVANVNESETLAALRDTLLPRLLSGEIRVADAERTVEEVV
ncbi:MAG: restriction endonuclease subunit S [Pirellulaceae bacterium]|nr:restriction endonuclease subunit S [Pirellulaceae bacterium]